MPEHRNEVAPARSLLTLASFLLQVFIEVSTCCLHVGNEPQKAYTERQQRKQSPADEAQTEQEEFCLVARHEPHALFDGLITLHIGIVFQHIGRHGIGKSLDDAGNDEQKCPKKDVNIQQQKGEQAL